MRVSSIFTAKKQSMHRKLFGYMLILVIILFIAAFLGFFLLGHFNNTKENLYNIMSLQMEVFEREITAHHDNIAMKSVHMSQDATNTLEDYLHKKNISFDNLNGSDKHLNNIQSELLEILKEDTLHTECSGAFILLNTTADSTPHSKSGVYIKRNSLKITDDTLSLYRGNSHAANEKDIIPHKKWQPEFDIKQIPGYNEMISADKNIPLEKACRVTSIFTCPDTAENIMLVTAPIRSYNGEVLGICGFELSSNTFKTYHAQPSTLEHLVCIFSEKDSDSIGLSRFTCNVSGEEHISPGKVFSIKNFGKGLKELKSDNDSYIGLTRDIRITNNPDTRHTLTVMIPKYEYSNMLRNYVIETVIFILLLLFFAISCCAYLSKRYISPILKGLEKIKHSEHDNLTSTYTEIDDLFDFLAEKDKELSRVQSEVDKLSYSRKKEIHPDDYENFLTGLETLTRAEKNIFEMYLSGKTAKEITEIVGIKESTLKYHNHNIYEKLGVSSRKQMLRYAAIYNKEKNENK